jgi:hypothetical protein
MQRVVGFVYAKSHRLFCNLTNMRQKPLACFGLHVGMVPKAYQHVPDGYLFPLFPLSSMPLIPLFFVFLCPSSHSQ